MLGARAISLRDACAKMNINQSINQSYGHKCPKKHRTEVLQIGSEQKLHSRIPQSDGKKRTGQMLVVK